MSQLIVVTGAAGFIGRNVVAELNRRGFHNLLLTDLLGKDEKWKNLIGLEYEDLIPPSMLMDRLHSGQVPAAVIHLGACSATTERDADYLLENNYRYTRTLCDWCVKQGVRFVYASSAATYGDGSEGYVDDESKLTTLRPLNMYGYSKHMFDLWAHQHGLFDRIVGLKYFNVYGPYETHKAEMRSVVHRSFEQIKASGRVKLFKSYKPDYKDGQQKRDFIYVRDAVEVTLHFALEATASGGLFNCGTGESRTWLDLANAVFAAMNAKPHIEFIDMPEGLKGKYQYFTEADSYKLRDRGGFTRRFTSIEDGAKDYVDSYLNTLEV